VKLGPFGLGLTLFWAGDGGRSFQQHLLRVGCLGQNITCPPALGTDRLAMASIAAAHRAQIGDDIGEIGFSFSPP